MRFRYSQWTEDDEKRSGKLGLQDLMNLFNQLLLQTNGDVAEALQWMNFLDRKYDFTKGEGLGQFIEYLEKEGYITGYHAHLDPEMLGYNMLVFVEISLSYQSPDSFQKFSKAVQALPYILECHLVSGDSDYLIKARISGMSEYRALLGDMLLTLPGVKNSKSYIVMEEVKESLELPLDYRKK